MQKYLLPIDVADRALMLLVDGLVLSKGEKSNAEVSNNDLAQELLKIQYILSAFQSHVQRHAASIRRQQNLLAPISRLPTEVLAEIFITVVESQDSASRYRINYNISCVSSRWYATSHSTPRMWNHVVNTMEPRIWAIMLKRSKQVPLHIKCYGDDRSKQFNQRFLDFVVPHISRWKSCYISSYHSEELALRYLANQIIPILEDFTFCSRRNEEDAVISQARLNISAPSLKYLTANAFTFPLRLDQGLHSNLRSIIFSPSIAGQPFLLKHYHQLLSSAPRLEEVEIIGVSGSWLAGLHMDGTCEVQLYNLRTLSLTYLPWDDILVLLSLIVTLHEQPVSVTTSYPIISFTISFPLTARPNSLLSTVINLDRMRCSTYTSGHRDVLVLCTGSREGSDRGPQFSLEIKCLHSSPRKMLSQLLAAEHFPRVQTMELASLRLCPPTQHYWSPSSLPSLQALKIRSPGHEDVQLLDEMLRMLSCPVSPNQGTSWICPQLQYIAIDSWVNSCYLLPLLQSRGRNDDATPLSPNLPCGLVLVELRGYKGTFVSALREELIHLALHYNVKLRCRDLSNW